MDCPYCSNELKIESDMLYTYSRTLCCDKDIIVKQHVTYTVHPIVVTRRIKMKMIEVRHELLT